MHAICLWAPQAVTEARGRPRSIKDGKVYSTKSYKLSMANTMEFGLHWQERIRAEDDNYKSVSFYDNAVFPSRLVHIGEFEKLINLSELEAAEHVRLCERKHC